MASKEEDFDSGRRDRGWCVWVWRRVKSQWKRWSRNINNTTVANYSRKGSILNIHR